MRTDSHGSRFGAMVLAFTIFVVAPVAFQLGMAELAERFGVVRFAAGIAAAAAAIWFIASYRKNGIETVWSTIHFLLEIAVAVGVVYLLFWLGFGQLMDRMMQDYGELRVLLWSAGIAFVALFVWVIRWSGRLIFGDDRQGRSSEPPDDGD